MGGEAERITAFLFHDGGHDDPEKLEANAGQSFQGSIVLGIGFTFDDTDKKGVATPLAEMERLIHENPGNRDVIFPYIGGEEVNTSPIHAHHRYVINFRDWPLRRADLGATWRGADDDTRRDWRRDGIVPLDYPEPVAFDWPELLGIVEESVKPARAHLTTNAIGRKRAQLWWRYGSTAGELYSTIKGLDRVLVTGAAAVMHHMISSVSATQVFSHKLIVFPISGMASFAALQSRPHEIWSAFFGATFGSIDALTYNPTNVFQTFPFPENWQTHPALEAVGKAYYDYRAALMVENDEGMTKTYNRFHDPDERDPRIAELRRLHAAMDRAVLHVYGWDDIPTDCEFLLDYEINEETWGRKKKPWRYRWPDAVRDDVLARLLALNTERAAGERIAGSAVRLRATS